MASELLQEQGSVVFIRAGLILATASSAGRSLHCISCNPKQGDKKIYSPRVSGMIYST